MKFNENQKEKIREAGRISMSARQLAKLLLLKESDVRSELMNEDSELHKTYEHAKNEHRLTVTKELEKLTEAVNFCNISKKTSIERS